MQCMCKGKTDLQFDTFIYKENVRRAVNQDKKTGPFQESNGSFILGQIRPEASRAKTVSFLRYIRMDLHHNEAASK